MTDHRALLEEARDKHAESEIRPGCCRACLSGMPCLPARLADALERATDRNEEHKVVVLAAIAQRDSAQASAKQVEHVATESAALLATVDRQWKQATIGMQTAYEEQAARLSAAQARAARLAAALCEWHCADCGYSLALDQDEDEAVGACGTCAQARAALRGEAKV